MPFVLLAFPLQFLHMKPKDIPHDCKRTETEFWPEAKRGCWSGAFPRGWPFVVVMSFSLLNRTYHSRIIINRSSCTFHFQLVGFETCSIFMDGMGAPIPRTNKMKILRNA